MNSKTHLSLKGILLLCLKHEWHSLYLCLTTAAFSVFFMLGVLINGSLVRIASTCSCSPFTGSSEELELFCSRYLGLAAQMERGYHAILKDYTIHRTSTFTHGCIPAKTVCVFNYLILYYKSWHTWGSRTLLAGRANRWCTHQI